MARKDLKGESLTAAGSSTPPPMAKYQTDHGRPGGKMPAIAPTPRADGSMATGETGGNYDPSTMDRLPNGPGPRGTADVSDQLAEQFQNPGDSST